MRMYGDQKTLPVRIPVSVHREAGQEAIVI